MTLRYFRLIFTHQAFTDKFARFLVIGESYYPPFFHISTLPLVLLFGFSAVNLICVNFFYLILFLVSMYGIGKILFNQRVGILAGTITLFYPIMYALSREYLIDFALVAMVTAVQYLILKSEGGINKRWNILLGIMAGFALLTKSVAIIFFLPSWIYRFIRRFRKNKDFLPFFASLSIAVFICTPWYIYSFPGLLTKNSTFQYIATNFERDPIGFTPSLLWYADSLMHSAVSLILLLFSFIGLLAFWLYDKRWRVFLTLALWAFPSFCILLFTPNKDIRYIMPILPVLAFFTIGGIDVIKRKGLKNTLYFLIIAFGFLQFYDLSFSAQPFLKNGQYGYNRNPLKENWKAKEIVSFISKCSKEKNTAIGILPNLPYLNYKILNFYIEQLYLPYWVKFLWDDPDWKENFEKYDILITVSEQHLNQFKKIAEFKLPNNKKALVYKNIKSGLSK